MTYADYMNRLNIHDILVDAGYIRYKRDGLRYPSYVKTDSEGKRIRGDKFIVTRDGQCCFHPPVQKTYNIISFIKEHPEMFKDYTPGMNKDRLVNLVCTRLLNTTEEREAFWETNSQSAREANFSIDAYTLHHFEGKDKDSHKPFYPYFKSRGINLSTQYAFRKSFFLASRVAKNGNTYSNLAFPLTIAGTDKGIVGLEERGRARLDGTSGYKGVALGSNASLGMWQASPDGNTIDRTDRIYVFESAYDAMAYYQLKHKDDKNLKSAVFVSTVGNPSVGQMQQLIKATQAEIHLCFDNDLAGRQFCTNFQGEAQRFVDEQKRNIDNAPLKDLGTYDIPEWALCYIENGDADNLTDEEIKCVNDFLEQQFPDGFVMSIDWDNYNEINAYPAFGPRNENALVSRGESPYLATKTYTASFIHPSLRDAPPIVEQKIIREIPDEGFKDWNEQLLATLDNSTEKKLAGTDIDGDGIVESDECDEETSKQRHYHR